MAPGERTPGRRREDVRLGWLPEDVQPGDYWKYIDDDGMPVKVSEESTNLTGTMWGYSVPNGAGIGTLARHTVRENHDGTVTIAPNDGSSNSILLRSGNKRWHGYIDRGVWESVE